MNGGRPVFVPASRHVSGAGSETRSDFVRSPRRRGARPPSVRTSTRVSQLFLLLGSLLVACAPPGEGEMREPTQITVPSGASFQQVTDTLVARDVIAHPTLFRVVARVRGHDRQVRAGLYAIPPGDGWLAILDRLVEGRVVTLPVTIPEGWTLRQISGRLAQVAEVDAEEFQALLEKEGAHEVWEVPGPGLEGYLFPDTYHFTPGSSPETIVATMTRRYRSLWTAERRARAEELGFSEQEIMTLASIVQAEARGESEMPRIASVFHNRLRIGYLLQADPTVQYALGERRSRLLYRDIDSVADHPYNTYTRGGLPPGPIGAAGEAAIEATLYPDSSDYLYFVARPNGTHIFTRTLEEHNRARVEARRLWDRLEADRRRDSEQNSS